MSKANGTAKQPNNLEAERALLGAMVLDNRLIETVLAILPEHAVAQSLLSFGSKTPLPPGWHEPLFYSPTHQTIFGAICKCYKLNGAVDLTLLAVILSDSGLLETVGGSAYLGKLEDDIFSLGQVPQYARIVSEKYQARRLIRESQFIAESVMRGDQSLGDLMDESVARLEAVQRGAEYAEGHGLTIVDLDGLFSVTEDEQSASLVGDRVIVSDNLSLLVGAKGTGKSRLVSQLIVEQAIGTHWLGKFPFQRRELKILMFQDENSRLRMQQTLGAQLRGHPPEVRERVNRTLRCLIPEKLSDLFLSFRGRESARRMKQAVREVKPDLVIFDPWSKYAQLENQNDNAMAQDALQAMFEIACCENPKMPILLVAHSLGGKMGAGKAVGWDSDEFIKGAKAPCEICRSQINVVRGDAMDSDLLLISHGKCNDAKKFEPFAVRLDPSEMRYHYDPDFDFDQWQADLADKKPHGRRSLFAPTLVATLLANKGLVGYRETVRLIQAVGMGESTAKRLLQKAMDQGLVQTIGGKYHVLQ